MPTCPSCGRELPGEFPFCPFCAAPLLQGRGSAAHEERKVVTVLFCDLVGFTAASDRQDPEDVRARIRPYHARVREEIQRYGGIVEKFVGDAVMAVFGAPVAHEDDVERAIRAGLGILDVIEELNRADPGLDLHVRVGINTGEAVVAIGARLEQGEGIVTGDVVNTAARIEGAAPTNGVAVGEQSYRTTRHVFEYEPLEPVSVKGKMERLPLWRARAVRIRFHGDSVRQYTTPFVGRELEKPLLIGTFERAAQQRSAQLVTVVGEPGVGKTRLIAELFAHISAKPELIRWRHGRCLPYGDGITFWALGEIVKAELAILESDSAEVAAAKLEAAVSPDEPDRRWLLQRLGPLVGVEAPTPAERQELFTAWRRFFEGLAAIRPTVLVVDDLHWADEALLAFLEYLTEWSHDVPLLLLCAARPELYERRPGWGAGQRNTHTINLSPLSDSETAELVSNIVAAPVLSQDLEQAILERAGGNPLYAEEFVRLLADRGLDHGEDISAEALPESVQALIAARLDTLAPERKSLLHDAAVVGKVFWAGAVAEMSGGDPAAVELALHELARKELVRPARTSSMEGESEYSFWHLLIRDVAYSQLSRAERARRHRAAAAWIEQRAGERVEDLAEVLAFHYVQALELAEASGDDTQAGELVEPARAFLALAGERALGLDTTQAETRLTRALELTPLGHPRRPHLLVRWADAVFQAARPRDADDALEDALIVLRAHGEPVAAAQALQLRSRVSLRLGDGRMVSFAAESVALLENAPPGTAQVAAYEQLAHAQTLAGAYAEAIAAADRAIALAGALDLTEPARALHYRGFARVYLGDAGGIAEMERALELLLEQGAGREVGVVQNNLALARYPLDGPARSLADFEAGVSFCEQRGLLDGVRALGDNCIRLLVELGRTDEALARAGPRAAEAERSGDIHGLIELRAVELASRLARGERTSIAAVNALVEAAKVDRTPDVVALALATAAVCLADHAPERACSLLADLLEATGARETVYYARELPAIVRTALALREPELAKSLTESLPRRYALDEHAFCAAQAQLAEAARDHDRAAALYAEAAERWRRFGNIPELAFALLGRGRCLRALGDAGAHLPFVEACELFADIGHRPALAETEALLTSMGAASSP